MEKRPVPFEKTVFVCTNVRDGKIACANPGRGGDAICGALKEAVKEAGLKSTVRIARSGCLDRCAEGPNLFVYPDGEWYSRVGATDVPDILRKLASTLGMVTALLLAAAAASRAAPKSPGVEFAVTGFRSNCWDGVAVQQWEKGAWRQVNRQLPGKGLYFLDDRFVGYGACDYVTCVPIDGKVQVSLHEYLKTGTKAAPEGRGTSGQLPVFETVRLRGKLKVELTYFTDPKCTVRETVTKTLRR